MCVWGGVYVCGWVRVWVCGDGDGGGCGEVGMGGWEKGCVCVCVYGCGSVHGYANERHVVETFHHF